jgi:hypothetical protein
VPQLAELGLWEGGGGVSKYKDPRGIMAWNENIPKPMKKYGLPTIFQEEREWQIREQDDNLHGCPFCGADAMAVAFENRDDEEADRQQAWDGWVMFRVVCLLCGANGPSRRNLNDAVEEWNFPMSREVAP